MNTDDPQAGLKRLAGEYAANLVHSGMVIGLGTGSTSIHAIRRIASRITKGELQNVVAFATSQAVAREAASLGIVPLDDDMPRTIDLTIDGADEVDASLDLIKGGGGALLREKIAAQASARVVIVVDQSKLTRQLGARQALPVEVLPYGWCSQARFITALGAEVALRRSTDGSPRLTDQDNYILDCRFGPIANARALADALAARAGIVEHGLFLGLANEVIVASANGIRHLRREGP
jgi:ribose 5-phosphate isomerase A